MNAQYKWDGVDSIAERENAWEKWEGVDSSAERMPGTSGRVWT